LRQKPADPDQKRRDPQETEKKEDIRRGEQMCRPENTFIAAEE